jgi:hypothetical protein
MFATGFAAKGFAQERPKPKLILQITVDQLRGDLLERYYDRLGEGGFGRRAINVLDHSVAALQRW